MLFVPGKGPQSGCTNWGWRGSLLRTAEPQYYSIQAVRAINLLELQQVYFALIPNTQSLGVMLHFCSVSLGVHVSHHAAGMCFLRMRLAFQAVGPLPDLGGSPPRPLITDIRKKACVCEAPLAQWLERWSYEP